MAIFGVSHVYDETPKEDSVGQEEKYVGSYKLFAIKELEMMCLTGTHRS